MKPLRAPNGALDIRDRCVNCGQPLDSVVPFVTNYGRDVQSWVHKWHGSCKHPQHRDDVEKPRQPPRRVEWKKLDKKLDQYNLRA